MVPSQISHAYGIYFTKTAVPKSNKFCFSKIPTNTTKMYIFPQQHDEIVLQNTLFFYL